MIRLRNPSLVRNKPTWRVLRGAARHRIFLKRLISHHKVVATIPRLAPWVVIITGTSREDLNGKTGLATDFDHAKGRYVVAWGGKGEKAQVMKIKPQNLRLKQ